MSSLLPHAKKSLGQHWLTDETSLMAMCDAANVGSEDTILEIGPGVGTLTEHLVERAHKVIAIEFDDALAAGLPGRIPASNLKVVNQDILRFDLTSLPPDYKVVANIPYYLTSNLIRVLSETPNRPLCAVLLVQKEVAERVAAVPGGMSLLSVTAQYYWEVSVGPHVPARLFTPPPKVDSQILILGRKAAMPLDTVEAKRFFQVVKAGFSNRRKTLLNSLSAGLHLGKEDTQDLLAGVNVASTQRPQELSLDQWLALYHAVA
jgi:16S rRNA (adenine1518-N6/adenine1519-N6)-dimethyltransferase